MLAAYLLLAELPLFAAAYSWNFQSPPQQCSNLTVQISGSDGVPPYRLLIVPFGPTPFANNTEVRRLLDLPFNNSNSISFQLKFPQNSQFVAVVSDSSGFGTGGTSAAATVTTSSDASCFDASQSVSLPFTFSINPENQIVQCEPTRLFWTNTSAVQGNVSFVGIIPGGESFSIPEGPIDNESSQGLGTGFSWIPSIRGGTTFLLVGGDQRGIGSGGSAPYTVSSGINNNSTCLNAQSPSSTPGSPAGGSYPTSLGDANNGGSSSSSGNNTGAIVGGIIGGLVLIAALILVLFFLRRRDRYRRHHNEKPVDLLIADDDNEEAERQNQQAGRTSRNELPQYYEPQPFVLPDPTVASETDASSVHEGAGIRNSFISETGTSSQSVSTRKGGYIPRMRPVNIIQHDDAGPSVREDEEEETIELPPAYTNIRKTSEMSGDVVTASKSSLPGSSAGPSNY